MRDLGFFLRLFAPHWLWLAGGILLSLAAALAAIGLLTLSGWFITTSALAGLWVADGAALTFNFMVPAAQIRALAIARTLGRYAERLVTHEATFRALAETRCWFFQRLIPLAPGRLSVLRSGDLLARMTADIDALDALYLRLLAPITVAVIGGSAVVALLYRYSTPISIVVLAAWIVASVITPWFFYRLGRRGSEQVISLSAEYRSGQIDMLQGMTDLLVSGAHHRYFAALNTLSDGLIDVQRGNNRLTAFSSALSLGLSQLTVLAVSMIGVASMREGQLSGPDLALLVFCVFAAFELTAPLPKAMQMLGATKKAAARIRNTAELPSTLTEPEQSVPLPERFDLTIDEVGFRYSETSDWVLQHVSLSIPHGHKIAVLGPSGSGKTTLLHLLMRFYEPVQGHIALAGHDYRNFRSEQLMTCFAVLSQRSQLFAATIKENLLLAKPGATDAELISAVEMAGLETLIRSLPEGMETWVGENGVRVSGGEARRIALARLYLKNAPIVFLDEPTEGLDAATERDVLTALAEFCRNKTIVMATHRPAGLNLVDNIYTIEDQTVKPFQA